MIITLFFVIIIDICINFVIHFFCCLCLLTIVYSIIIPHHHHQPIYCPTAGHGAPLRMRGFRLIYILEFILIY